MSLATAHQITAAFTGPQGFHFARWSVPIAPMVYGVDPASTAVLKAGQRLICDLTGHRITESDPAAGYNHVTVHCRDWADLAGLPPLGFGIDGAALGRDLTRRNLSRHLLMAFGADGGIHRALHLVRLDAGMAGVPADLMALAHALITHLHWGPAALEGGVVEPGSDGLQIRADLLTLLRAAYDPRLPVASADPALALRLAARLAVGTAT